MTTIKDLRDKFFPAYVRDGITFNELDEIVETVRRATLNGAIGAVSEDKNFPERESDEYDAGYRDCREAILANLERLRANEQKQ